MKTQKTSQKINCTLTIVIVVAIIAAINFISYQIFARLDLTSDKIYSLSSASKKTVANLDDLVIVKAYLSKNLPPEYLSLEQEIEDTLKDYQNYSSGKFKYQVINPPTDAETIEDLGMQGIPAISVQSYNNDSFQVINGYLGLIVEYGGETEVIPVVNSVSNLEYNLTLAIKKLTTRDMPILGIVSGNEEISQALSVLNEIYKVETIDLKSEEEIGTSVSALLISAPKEEFSEDQLKKIDSFVVSGRPVVFLVDGVNVDSSVGAAKNSLGLEKLFNSWGVVLNNDLVADVSNGRASISSSGGSMGFTYLINYPLWPKILPENFDQESAIVSGLQSLVLPWASSLTINPIEGIVVSKLLKSTEHAWSQSENFDINPSELKAPSKGKQYVLGAILTGKIKSIFSAGETDSGKIAIIGDSDFASDNFTGGSSDNLIFFQNLVDGLALDSDLISIRSKASEDRPIKSLSAVAKEIIRYINIFVLAILILIFGFIRYFWRRRGKRQKINNNNTQQL